MAKSLLRNQASDKSPPGPDCEWAEQSNNIEICHKIHIIDTTAFDFNAKTIDSSADACYIR